MMDAQARGLPQGPHLVWCPEVRGGMWFRRQNDLWLSEQEYHIDLAPNFSILSDNSYYSPLPLDYAIYITAWEVSHYLGTGGAPVWVTYLYGQPGNVVLGSKSTTGTTQLRWYGYHEPVNVLVDGRAGNVGTTIRAISMFLDETAGTAGFYGLGIVMYRLVMP